jgi:hypothetical protein
VHCEAYTVTPTGNLKSAPGIQGQGSALLHLWEVRQAQGHPCFQSSWGGRRQEAGHWPVFLHSSRPKQGQPPIRPRTRERTEGVHVGPNSEHDP